MTLPSDRSHPISEPMISATSQRLGERLESPQVDLVFVQDGKGNYLSFQWQGDSQYGFDATVLVGRELEQNFAPLAIGPYQERVQQVLTSLEPIEFDYPFCCHQHCLVFRLILSPILTPYGSPTTVLAIGRFLYAVPPERALELIENLPYSCVSLHRYRSPLQLTQMVRNIRRSLDLDTIWELTVNGLGTAFGASRCLICPYKPGDTSLTVAADYSPTLLPSMVKMALQLEPPNYLSTALTTLKPVVVDRLEEEAPLPPITVLAVPTTYQDQPNGLIILHQPIGTTIWKEADIEQLRDIANQIGTGIAHATLLQEARSLAAELRRANESLMQQHHELEEARQQAEAASRLKSEFLANTSHELRTPLNGMIGFLKLIMDGMADDPEEQNQFLQEAYRSAIHLLNIINDILDIAKIEAGKMQLDLNPIKLDELLNDVHRKTLPQAQQKGLIFEVHTPATRDEIIINGNYQRLLQVMLNLVGNAVKFTHEGQITISAEVLPRQEDVLEDEQPGMVKISVADTGIGVSLEKQDKLFQSFSQVDGSRTRQYGGTGLGLAISQKLVETMGGIVNFYSMGEGLGSTVTFTVPLYQDPVIITEPIADSIAFSS